MSNDPSLVDNTAGAHDDVPAPGGAGNTAASKTPWYLSYILRTNIAALLSMLLPSVRDWLASNPVEFTTALGAVNVLLQFISGGKYQLTGEDGQSGQSGMSVYSAAKAAIINFSRAAAAEGAAAGIRVNVVIPAVVETPATAGMLADEASRKNTEKLIPMGRVGQSSELANAVLFLASDEASYVTGAALPVDGGRSAVLVTAL